MTIKLYSILRLMHSSSDHEAAGFALNLVDEFLNDPENNPWVEERGVTPAALLVATDVDSELMRPLLRKILSHPDAPVKTLHKQVVSDDFLKHKEKGLGMTFTHVLARRHPELVGEYVEAGCSLAAFGKNDVGVLPFITDVTSVEMWFQHAKQQNVDITGGDEKVSWVSVYQKLRPVALSAQELSLYQRSIADLRKKYPIVLTEEERVKTARREFVHAIRTLPGKNVVSSSLKLHGLEKLAKKDEEFYRNCVEAFKDAVGSRLGVYVENDQGYREPGVAKNEQNYLKTMANWFLTWGEKCFPEADTGLKSFLSLYSTADSRWHCLVLSKSFREYLKDFRKFNMDKKSSAEKIDVFLASAEYIQNPSVLPGSFYNHFAKDKKTLPWSDVVKISSVCPLWHALENVPYIYQCMPENPSSEDKAVLGKIFLESISDILPYYIRGYDFWEDVERGFSGAPNPVQQRVVESLECYLRTQPAPFIFEKNCPHENIRINVQALISRENLRRQIGLDNGTAPEKKLRM